MKIPYRLKKILIQYSFKQIKRLGLINSIQYLGLTVPLNIPILTDEIRKSFLLGNYESDECRHITEIIDEGERVLEIGVGLGILTCLIIKNQRTQSYLGYEANPEVIPWATDILNINKASHTIENAVLTCNPNLTNVSFYLRENFWASSLSPEPWSYQKTINVHAHNFNEIITEFKPTLIICDIEGGEFELFMKADLDIVDKIYLELHPKVLGEKKTNQLIKSLESKGFNMISQYSIRDVYFFKRKSNK